MSTAATPTYLIKLGLGSVQPFIGAARRSRDLWAGSWLIAEVIKAAARYLDDQGTTVTLISPALPYRSDDLAPGSDFQPSNVVLARVQTDDDPAAFVNGALDAARHRWRELNEQALAELQQRLRGSNVEVDAPVWRAQAEDALELFGVWLLWSDPAAKLPLAELDAFYSARKRTRTFRANLVNAQRDKSSLDARGESVLIVPDKNSLTPRLRYRLGLNSTEHLDAPGWTKRLGTGLGGPRRRFTPLIRVALEPWLRALAGNVELAPLLAVLREDCGKLAQYKLVTPVDAPTYQDFPFDAEWLLPSRWRAAQRELDDLKEEEGSQEFDQFQKDYQKLTKLIDEKFPAYRRPEPYLAILCADGDQLGKIQPKCSLKQLQALSLILSRFALTARDTVAECKGDCIYAGGDELLALAPLDQLWPCLGELRNKYVTVLANPTLPPEAASDSDYSIGVAIVHASERDALALARKALALAKNVEAKDPKDRRKALGIIYQPRSGATVRARLRWAPVGQPQPTESLQAWQEAFRAKQWPKRTPYVLRRLLATHSWVFEDYCTAKALLPGEIRRVLARRQPAEPATAAGPAPLEQLATEISDLIASSSSKSKLEDVLGYRVNALLIARSVAEHYP